MDPDPDHLILMTEFLSACQVITQDHYAEDFCFSDPIVRIQGKASYAQSLRLLTTAFDIKHTVHSTSPGSGPEEIVTRQDLPGLPDFSMITFFQDVHPIEVSR